MIALKKCLSKEPSLPRRKFHFSKGSNSRDLLRSLNLRMQQSIAILETFSIDSQVGMNMRITAHTLWDGILCNISSKFANPDVWLPQGITVQLFYDPIELCFRERRVQKIRKHMPFVWCYILPVASIGTLSLKKNTNHFWSRKSHQLGNQLV